MTIQFDTGLSVHIPDDQVMVPNLTIDPQTGQLLANSSDPELVINSIQQVKENDLPELGRQFLSSAYLMVKQDAHEFALCSANPTANEDLVAVDTQNQVIDEFCSSTTGGSATSPSTTVPNITARDQSSVKLSAGGIAGTVVGSVALVTIILDAVFWITQRRKAATPETGTGFTSLTRQSDADTMSSSTNTYVSHEMYAKPISERPQMQELPQYLSGMPIICLLYRIQKQRSGS